MDQKFKTIEVDRKSRTSAEYGSMKMYIFVLYNYLLATKYIYRYRESRYFVNIVSISPGNRIMWYWSITMTRLQNGPTK